MQLFLRPQGFVHDGTLHILPGEILLPRAIDALFEESRRRFQQAEPHLDGDALDRCAWLAIEDEVRRIQAEMWKLNAQYYQAITGDPLYEEVTEDINRPTVYQRGR